MEPEHKKIIKDLFKLHDNPMALLDERLFCIYCTAPKLLPAGKSLAEYAVKPFDPPRDKITNEMVAVNGVCYCARFTPYADNTFICEFFGDGDLFSIAENTDFYEKVKPFIVAADYNIANLWKTSKALQEKLEVKELFDEMAYSLDVQKSIAAMSSVVKGASEYVNMTFTDQSTERIDAYSLVDGVIKRCNTILAKSGRCIEFIAPVDGYLIAANQRHTISALVHAIQNALLYSPADSVPMATLSMTEENGTKYVVFQIINDSVYFVNKKFSEELSMDFAFQHIGLGIATIRRFAEETGGSFYMDNVNGKVTLGIKIPMLTTDPGKLRFECSIYSHYNSGIPDILDVKMMEVNEFFGENCQTVLT